eukprot:6703177-Prymnesium_polylepis.1
MSNPTGQAPGSWHPRDQPACIVEELEINSGRAKSRRPGTPLETLLSTLHVPSNPFPRRR